MGIVINKRWRIIRGFTSRDDAVNFVAVGNMSGRVMVKDVSGRFAYLLVEELQKKKDASVK